MSSLSILDNLDRNFSGNAYNSVMGRSRMAKTMNARNERLPLAEYGSSQRSLGPGSRRIPSVYESRQRTQELMDYDLMKREQKRALSAMADRASREEELYKPMMRNSGNGRQGASNWYAREPEMEMSSSSQMGGRYPPSRPSRSLMELEGQMMQLEQQIEMRRRNEEMLKRELARDQMSRRSMSAYPMMPPLPSLQSRPPYSSPFSMPPPPMDFMRSMMPPPPMPGQMRHPQNRSQSPLMIRKVPQSRPGELEGNTLVELENDDDVLCVDDGDFDAEGFINSGGASREVLMGRRKLAPGQKAPVKNRLGVGTTNEGGGPGVVTAKNRFPIEGTIPDLMGVANPTKKAGLADRIGGSSPATLEERLGVEGTYMGGISVSGRLGGGLGKANMMNRLGAANSALSRLSGVGNSGDARSRLSANASKASDNEERKNALVIMPIPASTSEDEIKAVFVNATHISSVSFTKPRKNRFAPGEICCAIVEFDAPETCAEALESVSSSELEIAGMKCKAQKSEEKRKRRFDGGSNKGGIFTAKRQFMDPAAGEM